MGRHHISDLASYPCLNVQDREEKEDTKAKRQRLLDEMNQMLTELEPKMKEWEKQVGKDKEEHKVGNTNVAAHGVRLQIGDLAWGVMLNLSEIVDACYPEPSKMPGIEQFDEYNAQRMYLEELSASFVCLKDGSRIHALKDLDDLLHPDVESTVETVIVLQGEPNSGSTALLARFLHNHLFAQRDSKTLQQDYAFVNVSPSAAKDGADDGEESRNPARRRSSSVHIIQETVMPVMASQPHVASPSLELLYEETSWSGKKRVCTLPPVRERVVGCYFAGINADVGHIYWYSCLLYVVCLQMYSCDRVPARSLQCVC